MTIISILFGGIVGSMVTILFTYFMQRRDFIRKQIDNLYAPLYMQQSLLIAIEEEISKIVEKLNFMNIDEAGIAQIDSSFDEASFAAYDRYTKFIKSPLRNILKTIKNNFSLIDTDDIEVFREFFIVSEKFKIDVEQMKNRHLGYLQSTNIISDYQKSIERLKSVIEIKFRKKKDILQWTYPGVLIKEIIKFSRERYEILISGTNISH